MQHSDKTIILKRIVKIIVFIVLLVGINHLFRAGLEYPEAASADMIEGYTRTENLDAIVVGSSVAEMVDADKLGELLGCRAYNMCTPSQSYAITADVIDIAASRNEIRNVYYFVSFDATERRYDDIPERTFRKVVNASHPPLRRVANNIRYNLSKSLDPDIIKKQDSINIWFPWIDNNVELFGTIMTNFDRRVGGLIRGNEPGSSYEFDIDEKFYNVKPAVITDDDKALLELDLKKAAALDFPEGMVEPSALVDLNRLCILCRDNDISLYMFISPHRSDYRDRYDVHYEKLDNYMKDFVENRGGFYYNFESDPDIHNKLPDSDFYDWEHVNAQWVDDATTIIAEQIAIMKNDNNN